PRAHQGAHRRVDLTSGRRTCRVGRRTEPGTVPRTDRRSCRRTGATGRNEGDEVGAMRSAEGRGRTLDEAVDAALIELGESRRNVDVKVLNEGPEETLVEVTVIDQASATGTTAPADGEGEMARALVEGLLKHMGVRAQVTTRAGSEPMTLDISGRDLGALIGWRGETLRALQSVT